MAVLVDAMVKVLASGLIGAKEWYRARRTCRAVNAAADYQALRRAAVGNGLRRLALDLADEVGRFGAQQLAAQAAANRRRNSARGPERICPYC